MAQSDAVPYLCNRNNPVVLHTSDSFSSHDAAEIWVFAVAFPIASSKSNSPKWTDDRWTKCYSHTLSSKLPTDSVRLVISEAFVPACIYVSKDLSSDMC